MSRVTVEDVEELLDAFEKVATHCGDWVDSYGTPSPRIRNTLLRALTVASNGVRRGRAMLQDGDALIHVIEETKGGASDVAHIMSSGPQYVRDLYLGIEALGYVMWRRCQECGAEQ